MKGNKYVIECQKCGEVMAGYSKHIAVERKKDHKQKFEHDVEIKQKTEELDVKTQEKEKDELEDEKQELENKEQELENKKQELENKKQELENKKQKPTKPN